MKIDFEYMFAATVSFVTITIKLKMKEIMRNGSIILNKLIPLVCIAMISLFFAKLCSENKVATNPAKGVAFNIVKGILYKKYLQIIKIEGLHSNKPLISSKNSITITIVVKDNNDNKNVLINSNDTYLYRIFGLFIFLVFP